jgi:hypothetical protein
LGGYDSICDHTALTATEKLQVQEAFLRRNFSNCLGGYDTLCDKSFLTAEEKQEVHEAFLKRNLSNCLGGYEALCKRDALTPNQRTKVKSKASPSTSIVDPGAGYLPDCAENGSCYGDVSENNGQAKTIHVNGYFRKDGTYVRGHYRSKGSK